MNASIRRTMGLALAIASVATLAGCATMDDDRYATANNVRSIHDGEYIAAVEQMARPRGVRVVWVNPPERKQPADE